MSFWVGYNFLKPNLVNNVQVVDSEQTNHPYTPPFNVYHFLHCLFLEKKIKIIAVLNQSRPTTEVQPTNAIFHDL